MTEYRFVTTWMLRAPREQVFQEIWDSESWPQWWKGVEKVVKLEEGDEEGVGSLGIYTWKSKLPYKLEFETRTVAVDRPHYLEGHAKGELEGVGRWRLFEEEGLTAVVYEWEVRTTRSWMNRFAPLMGPVFRWNHDVIMGWGGQGLAKRLELEGGWAHGTPR